MGVLDDPTIHRIYAVEMTPYNPTVGGEAEVTLYAATEGFTTGPTDTPANTYFEGVVKEALSFSRQMFSGIDVGGRSMPNRGQLVLINGGDLDGWADYHFDGRSVTVKVGQKGAAYTAFETIFVGVMGEISMTRDKISVPLADRQDLLDKLVQGTAFAGTGGVEGGDDLKDKPKPVCVGECKNVAPVAVDITNRIYQFHDGQVDAVTAVYDNGKLLTVTTNYTVDLSTGRITLVAEATGLITADVKGCKDGGIYVSSAADVIRRLVSKYGGLTDPGDLDTASLTALNTATTAPVGFYAGSADMNLLDVLDQVASSVGAVYGYTRLGLFTVKRFEAPSGTAALVLDENDALKNSVRPAVFAPPRWRVRLGYAKSWTVQTADGLDAASTDAFKAFAGEEHRLATAQDADIKADGVGKGGHTNAVDPDPVQTLLVNKTDAETEAARRLALFGVRRWVVPFTAKTTPFETDLGDVVTFSHPRFGLESGQDWVVVSLSERAFKNEISLELWG